MFDTKAALKRLCAIGITTAQASQILAEVQRWALCSGEEWTVDRVKAIKLNLLRRYSDLDPIELHTWIRYDKMGYPKGPFKVLFKLPKKQFGKAWNAVMVYTGFVFDHPETRVTAKQWKKAITAIKRGDVEPDALIEGLKLVHQTPFYVKVKVLADTGDPLLEFRPSESRRAPAYFKTVPEVEGIMSSLIPLIRRSNWTTDNWDILSGTCAGIENRIKPYLELNAEDDEKSGGPVLNELPEMGIIALIPEPGYKLRFAANPYRVYQQALKPLGDALFAALKRVPNDFTFDQEAGVRFIQHRLEEGLEPVSMDLSNATDNAPLELQLALLGRLGVATRWLQFFRDTCRGEWHVTRSKSHDKVWESLNWSVGSPLGLYPTFASFALWHHSLVQWCFQEEGVVKNEDYGYPYAIVGDDVVILDPKVASLYRLKMNQLGVPISFEKTLSSANTAEFVGRIITRNNVVQGLKWKGRVTDESFVALARNIGPGALILMNARQRRVLSFIADLPEPYGLGWNPLGIPLYERWNDTLETAWSREKRVPTFESRASAINRILYSDEDSSSSRLPGFDVSVDDLASDQEVGDLVASSLPGWESMGLIMLPNVIAIDPERETPLNHSKLRSVLRRNGSPEMGVRPSTLVVLERKIRLALRTVR